MSDQIAPAPADNVNAPPPAIAPAPAAPPPAAPADWRSDLPDDIRESPSLAKFTSKEAFAKSYVSLEKMLGSDKVVVPKEGDTEGWKAFYKAAGAVEKPEDYGFAKPATVPEGVVYNPELDAKIAGILHGASLNKQQAAAVREGLMAVAAEGALGSVDAAKQAEAQKQQAIAQGEAALKAEWGQAYDQRGKVAGAAINKFLSPETITALEAAGVANHPAIVKDMYNMGVKLAGEKELIGAAEQSQSPVDLQAAIADHTAKHSAALFDRSHPEHAQRVKEREQLFNRRFPERAA